MLLISWLIPNSAICYKIDWIDTFESSQLSNVLKRILYDCQPLIVIVCVCSKCFSTIIRQKVVMILSAFFLSSDDLNRLGKKTCFNYLSWKQNNSQVSKSFFICSVLPNYLLFFKTTFILNFTKTTPESARPLSKMPIP